MRTLIAVIILQILSVSTIESQQWMRSLPIAQDLALVQNKMILMVWEGTTEYPYPVLVNDSYGRTLFVRDLFSDENVSPIIWENFVPVIVSEDLYGEYYLPIKGKRSQNYMEKFNDESIKIMDANGNILNTSYYYEPYQNITRIIKNYALNTEYLNSELRGYREKKDFYSAYYLSSKYLDFALYSDRAIRGEVLKLAKIYSDEATQLAQEQTKDDVAMLLQRLELLRVQRDLIDKKPRSAVRKLKRLQKDGIEPLNTSTFAFLAYTTYSCLDRDEEAQSWKSDISSVNLKKSQMIINLNRN